jgi:hypothetical protein
MLEKGMISNDQLIDILRCIEMLKSAAPQMVFGHRPRRMQARQMM